MSGIEPHEHVTAWVALSDATEEAGCMEVVSSRGRPRQLHHAALGLKDSINGGGQAIVEDFDQSDGEMMALPAGSFSLRHTLCRHRSAPNRAAHRRVGIGISYIPAHCRLTGTVRMCAPLVRGRDCGGHFDLLPPLGYGDTAVAECAIALMWASARGLARMDRGMRVGRWLGVEGVQLTGKTLGLVGFGGIAAEVARLALGSGLKVLAWNRRPRTYPGIEFAALDEMLARSDVVSLHLLLTEETRGFLTRQRIAAMKPGVILVNTARGALVDEEAMIEALRSGHIRHAGLDVFAIEPLPAGNILTMLDNVTLSAHSGFRTPEAGENLIAGALDHCRRIAAAGC
jgi:lactate dehydrogenase-like 2-hydroxyacid dehydrogenase